jgi:hypothetical protein
MIWIRLALMIAVFVASSFGLGYLAGLCVRRLRWAGVASGIMAVTIACLWPVIGLVWLIYSADQYQRQHPHQINDAPAMVLMSFISVGVPLLFIFGLPLALFGVALARHRYSQTANVAIQGASE